MEAIQDADPPLTLSAQSKSRYAGPVIANAIAPHRGGKVSELEAKAVLRHLTDTGLITVEERKIKRDGGRSDLRKGLFPTATGAAILQDNNVPQPPQSPADASAGNMTDAIGDQLLRSPQCRGVWGEMRGPELRDVEQPAAQLDSEPRRPKSTAAADHQPTGSASPKSDEISSCITGLILSVGEPE